MAKKKQRYKSFRLYDRTGCIQHPLLVVGESFEAYRVIYQERYQFQNKVSDGTTLFAHIAEDEAAARKQNVIYYKQPSSPELLAELFKSLRDIALQGGASPEAIRLMDEMSPFTDKERKNMAEKLKAKASAAKPDKEGLKTAAKSAPVAKGPKAATGKARGNPEALAKARAARAENKGPDTRKVKALVKAKELTARDGSFRRHMLEDLLSSKTVQEWRDKGTAAGRKYDAGCLKFATDNNFVSVS
jgi:hypothetical protein